MGNPYRVLGVSENATDDEIKRAYRDLSRKYHPDSYIDNPLKDLAEDKFKEVQEAYEEILKLRNNQGTTFGSSSTGSYSNSSYSNSSYNSSNYNNSNRYNNQYQSGNQNYQNRGQSRSQYRSQYQSSNTQQKYQSVYNLINFQQYRNALNELLTISPQDSTWYYLSAIANAGMGNNYQASEDINKAIMMDPGNQEFINFRNQLQMSTGRYQQNFNRYNAPARRNDDCSTGSCCCDLWVMDTCCECMGGDLCRCM